ncbi:MAG: DUF5678 domain-containing protein [Candidatus Bipolaricaulota bacterium]|nr:DUF5678 domain-containing protein [Candidatus Bipolaricaulota bacterium]MCS7274593.1 DUF5678 domain-containing protein [Candidatus Bipolaricaulota bacterium]MDW8110976.1 DUF5678 domain-containing protein [Candidatus Bipolaricaulota bacterium]MDW8329023.1 DUF5678 domain-containing protein [Candidatus Bipolaricaulota bacterium]
MNITQLQADDEWLANHLDELVERYSGRAIAIHQGAIIAVGDSEAEVYRQLRERGVDPMPLVFRVPRPEDLHSILATHAYYLSL